MSGEAKSFQRYRLRNARLPQFDDPEVESIYKGQVDARNAGRVKFASTFLLLLLFCVHGYDIVFLHEGSFESYLYLLGITGTVRLSWTIFLFLLRFTPPQYLEITLCTIRTYFLCTIAGLNAYRLKRLSLIDEISGGDYNMIWVKCDSDLAIHSRDTFLVMWILFGEAFFNAILPIRAILSWIPSVSIIIAFSSILIFPSLSLDDGGGTALLLMALVSCSSIIWYSRFLDEKKDRKLWALTRIREAESSWQRELLQLVFPIVVSVEDGRLKPLSLVQEHFGGEVVELADLPSRKDDGTILAEIEELVDEVEATGHPAKRNSLIHPRGAERVFECSVCACNSVSHGVILGFQINESWLSTADDRLDRVPNVMPDTESAAGSGTVGESEP